MGMNDVMGYLMFLGRGTGTGSGQVLMPVQQALLYGHCPNLLVHKYVRVLPLQCVICPHMLDRF